MNLDVRPEVAAFALLMERELRANDHKPGWKNDRVEAIVARVEGETRELSRAVTGLTRQVVWRKAKGPADRGNGWARSNPRTGEHEVGRGYQEMEGEDRDRQLDLIASEAADVANMAMMVADVCGRLKLDELAE